MNKTTLDAASAAWDRVREAEAVWSELIQLLNSGDAPIMYWVLPGTPLTREVSLTYGEAMTVLSRLAKDARDAQEIFDSL